MSSCPAQCSGLRPFIFILVLSFLLVLCTYRYPNMEIPYFSAYIQSIRMQYHTPPECSRWPNWDNSTPELENETNYAIILIWTWPFQVKFDTYCEDFGINKCYLTDDRSVLDKADGVFFHHRDINWEDLPKAERPCFQKWVWMNMESPDNTAPIHSVDTLFNLTCNYRLDASIPVPYGHLVQRTSSDPAFQLPPKDKLVCWIVSNWNIHLERVQYYKELKDHIKISSYGQAFGNQLSDKEYREVLSSCKFYLSFENSVYKDYITEKLFVAMEFGAVPVVLGPPRDDYQKQIPTDSFIHVNDFASPKELADRLHHLDKHTDEYMKYFRWRNEYKVRMSWFGKEHACRTCGYIQKNRRPEVSPNLIEWFWG